MCVKEKERENEREGVRERERERERESGCCLFKKFVSHSKRSIN